MRSCGFSFTHPLLPILTLALFCAINVILTLKLPCFFVFFGFSHLFACFSVFLGVFSRFFLVVFVPREGSKSRAAAAPGLSIVDCRLSIDDRLSSMNYEQ